MAQKTVSLSEKAYEKLKSVKKPEESFSQVILRLIEQKVDTTIADFIGAFEENSTEWEKIEQEIYERRKEKSRLDTLLEE